MSIRPTDPDQPRRAATLGETPSAVPRREETPDAAPGAPVQRPNEVDLSEATHRLQEKLGLDSATVSRLPPERLRQVLERMSQGFYDRAEIRDQVLRGLAADFETGSSQE